MLKRHVFWEWLEIVSVSDILLKNVSVSIWKLVKVQEGKAKIYIYKLKDMKLGCQNKLTVSQEGFYAAKLSVLLL